jgi:ABC-type dipeptide/oligopeptide/nickel transport system permease component
MLAFVVRRILWSVPVLLFVLVVSFALLRGAGGTPFNPPPGYARLPSSLQVQLTNFYNLDQPWFVEFLTYLKNIALLDFGPSLTDRYTSVDSVIEQSFPVTVELALLASAFAVPLGITLGLAGALHAGTRLDALLTSAATILLVVPVFLFAEVVSDRLIDDWGLLSRGWDGWGTKLVPAVVLGLAPAGYVARLVRTAAVETLSEPYVVAARAKGLGRRRIVLVHVLRNSLTPFLSAAVPTLALLVTGAFFVESAFGIPGASSYFLDAARTRDYPMVLGLTAVLATVVLAASLAADIVAAALDPRIREERR